MGRLAELEEGGQTTDEVLLPVFLQEVSTTRGRRHHCDLDVVDNQIMQNRLTTAAAEAAAVEVAVIAMTARVIEAGMANED